MIAQSDAKVNANRDGALQLIDRLIAVAGATPGKFVIAGFGEDPDTGERVWPFVRHIDNRQTPAVKRAEMLAACEEIAQVPHLNAYILPGLMRADLPPGKKGGLADVRWRLAIVQDFDGGHDPATRHSRMPVEPHAEVESSPGNFQCWIFFNAPVPAADVPPVLDALSKSGACHCGKDNSHVFRMPDFLNWPNKAKVDAGRPREPVMARLTIEPNLEWNDGLSLVHLREAILAKWPDAFEKHKENAGGAGSTGGADFDWHQTGGKTWNPFDEALIRQHLNDPKYDKDRSKGGMHFIGLCKRRGYSPEQIVEVMLAHGDCTIIHHYFDKDGDGVSEDRVRADVQRVWGKVRPSNYDANPEHVFRWSKDETAAAPPPVREIFIKGGAVVANMKDAGRAIVEQGTDIFRRSNMIMYPVREVTQTHRGKGEVTRLAPVSLPGMIKHMTAAASFKKWHETSGEWRTVDCPPPIAQMYLADENEWTVRPLSGIVNTPTLRPDGSLLDKPGYDEATGLLFDPAGTVFPAIPAEPSKADAEAALGVLKHLISTFPFVDETARAVALSAILTAVVRRSLPTAPMHAYSSPEAGNGKGLLIDAAAIIATGDEAPVINQASEEENEKRLDSALIAGRSIICLDNCEQPIGGMAICSILTQQFKDVRPLGQSKLTRSPTNAAMFASGNNITVAGDATRRVLICNIDANCERPETRQFKNDVRADARRDRGKLVAAALTILRAYRVAGQPPVMTVPLGSFEEWSRTVRDALVWLGEADPEATIETARAGDPVREQLGEVIHSWWAIHGQKPLTTKQLIEAVRGTGKEGEDREALDRYADAIRAVASVPGGGLDVLKLGQYLKKVARKIDDKLRIVKDGIARGHVRWRVEQI